jgi:ABC-2 type transport system permease protein
MGTLITVIRYEILSAMRDRLPRTLMIVFLGMIAASSIIGWLTNQTVTALYNLVLADGLTTAANPFSGVSPLRYMSNTVIYMILIGALLASVAGVQASLRDRKMNTADLILSRPVSTVGFLAGKLLGQGTWLAGVLLVSAVTNWISISVITGSVLDPTGGAKILFFYGIGWVFLMGFVSLGMISGLRSATESTALLMPILIWAVMVFVVPQLGTAAHPVSLLNPVAAPPTQGGFFQLMNNFLGPLAVGEHFKTASSFLLDTGQSASMASLSFAVIVIFALVAAAVLLVTPRNTLRSALHE